MARQYADEFGTELDNKPFDRAFLDRFALSVAGNGPVVELGSGPAHVAAYLAERGVEISALDLSPRMVAEAHRLFPDLGAVVGDMLALSFEDKSLAGLVSFYSIIHFDDDQLRAAFSEMARVLRPGGLAALAFHMGDETIHRTEWWGKVINLDARLLPRDHIESMLVDAGIEIISSQSRAPYEPGIEYQSTRAYLVGRALLPSPSGGPGLPPFGLGYPRTELRRKLVDAVLHGNKIATAGLAEDFAPRTFEPLPVAGDRWMLTGFQDEPVAIVETTDVQVVPAGQVSLQFAQDEGEGFESVAHWRAAHERFWSNNVITDETPIVCEHLRVVERFE